MSKEQQNVVLENEKMKGTNKMTNLETQDYLNPSYPFIDGKISEELAIKKLMLLANNILFASEIIDEDFKIIIGYKALNKLVYSNTINKARRLNEIKNKFIEYYDEDTENLGYCLDNMLCEEAQLYYTTAKGKRLNEEISFEMEEIEEKNQINFQEVFREKINLLDLMTAEPFFKEDLLNGTLIDCYFKFNVDYDEDDEISDTSTVKAIFHMYDELEEDFDEITTYVWTYEIKSFLRGKSTPEFKVLSTPIDELYETDFSAL